MMLGMGYTNFSNTGTRMYKSHPGVFFLGAGWSSPVARQAHNLKVVGSNPTPATNFVYEYLPAVS